ncbi:hypothetical protein CL617_02160 [archaeon]|nr:hypothetical protein [archaeon]|tara:strand:+ start:6098 stop:6565 length:468 start_codon:yes stop_codon:yes gene_type:complete
MVKTSKEEIIWILLRISMGWIFFWAFIDKVFGLGYATEAGKSWLDGVSPTLGFLKFGTHGPLSGFYQSIAGSALVDWLFMIGLLGIGLALIFGVFIRFASYSGVVMMLLMWSALILPEHNPILDEHIIYGIILIGLAVTRSGRGFSLNKYFSKKK